MPEPHVVVIGGGFGGLAAARALARQPVRVTLVDRRNHHLFQPLLYQVATAGLAPSDIAEPIRSILHRQDNVEVRLAHVAEIDLDGRRLRLTEVPDPGRTVAQQPADRWLSWDKLVVAAGAGHSYFGNDQWERWAPGLKTVGDALEIRRRILTAFERAEWTDDPDERQALLTFVVVGAGPTGVELAGAISEVAFATVKRDFRHLDTSAARIVLVEGLDAVLPPYPEKLQVSAKRQLEDLGVEVKLGTMVSDVNDHGVCLGEGDDAEWLPAETVLWAAGVQGSPLARTLGVELDRSGRVPVEADCSVEGHPDAFVIGDLARFSHTDDGAPLPGLAPVATQMGTFVGEAIAADLAGGSRGTFRYSDKGSMATIGRSKAVMNALGLQLSGLLAWLAWGFVHIAFLVTFRNRLVVMTKWAWAWLTFDRASRLIWQGEKPPDSGVEAIDEERARAS